MGSLNLCPMLPRYVWAEQKSPQLFVVDCSQLVLAVVGPLWSHSFTGVSHQEKSISGLVGRKAPLATDFWWGSNECLQWFIWCYQVAVSSGG